MLHAIPISDPRTAAELRCRITNKGRDWFQDDSVVVFGRFSVTFSQTRCLVTRYLFRSAPVRYSCFDMKFAASWCIYCSRSACCGHSEVPKVNGRTKNEQKLPHVTICLAAEAEAGTILSPGESSDKERTDWISRGIFSSVSALSTTRAIGPTA